LRLEEAGCEIVRVTVPKKEDAAVLGEIKRRSHLPLICDIHFDYKMALLALDQPIDKIRINPGNIGRLRSVSSGDPQAKSKGLPMRIGVNAGSLERELVEKYGFPCPPAMVESAFRYIEIAESGDSTGILWDNCPGARGTSRRCLCPVSQDSADSRSAARTMTHQLLAPEVGIDLDS